MKRLTLGQVFFAAALAIGLIVGVAFLVFIDRAKKSILRQATEQQSVDADRTRARVRRELGHAERVLVAVDAAIHSGALDTDDEKAVEAALFVQILDDPRVEEVTFTRARKLVDGSSDELPNDPDRMQMSLFRTVDGALITQATRPKAGGGYALHERKHEGGRFASMPFEPPRETPDPGAHNTFRYIATPGSNGSPVWTDLSYSERDAKANLIGPNARGLVSVQKVVFDARDKFVGVLRVGLVTRGVDALLGADPSDAERQQAGRVVVVSTASDGGAANLVARVNPTDHLVEVNEDLRIEADPAVPEVTALFASPLLKNLGDGRPEGRTGTFMVNGEPWIATTRPLDVGSGGIEGWIVAVMVPESYYTAELERFERTFTIVFATTLALVIAVGAIVVVAVRRGLTRIVGTTSRMRSFDFAASQDESKLRDVDDVMRGLERAKTVVRAMGKYIPIDLVKRLYASNAEPELGGDPQEVSIMFTDIEGFTTLSEKLSPDDLARRLGDYLAAMTTAIEATGGTIDKYIGDAVMAIWNAPSPVPDHALAACRAALACMDAARTLYASPGWEGLPSLVTRFGIHEAEVLVGHFGAPTRLSYTALGDGVNLAARLEPLCKQYGVIALVSEVIYAEAKDEFEFRRIDRVAVKGKTTGIDVYELLGKKGAVVDGLDRARRYEEAFEAYLERRFDRAIEILEPQCDRDRASSVLRDRCKELALDPPADGWDGVHVASSK